MGFYVRTCVRVVGLLGALAAVPAGWASGEIITLKNGMQIRGALIKIPSMNQSPATPFAPPEGNVDVSKILRLDDEWRYTFVSSNSVRADGLAADAGAISIEKITIDKRVALTAGRRIGSVGPILRISPWDQYGNRIFSMQSERGPIHVVQGITLITPEYAKVEGLLVDDAYVWDMRIASSSIPSDVMSTILEGQIKQDDSRERLRVVTLYIQSERYRDALVELDRIMADFPMLKELADQRKSLFQLVAKDVIREIELRRDAGQHYSAHALLSGFPEKDVAGELLLKVGDVLGEYTRVQGQGQRVLELLGQHTAELAGHKDQETIARVHEEMKAELNIHTLDRMADYLRLAEDAKLKTDQKLSLAVSGWLLGSGAGTENLAETLSLVHVRDAAAQYLRSTHEHERAQILERLTQLEGSSTANVARILAHMKPPVVTEPQEGIPGLLKLTVPGISTEPEFTYYVQLPPEYDPYRRYPCVVTLHGSGSAAEDQIDWWAGPFDSEKRVRTGQATRQGYIVVAPAWSKGNQYKYEYSAREHAAVLYTLRDALRRFSIDTDRVFLSGHSMGGDAVWDIGLAHPDLWAGVMPIVARADKYVSKYWENAKGLPMYFIAGQMDANKIADNARELDRYMKKAGFDTIYVEFQGRGHEHFHDEIHRLFDWMGRQRRDFFPKEFSCVSLREWDNFFWWLEFADFPSQLMVSPADWEPRSGIARNEGSAIANNSIRVKSAAANATLYLAPELVDFERRISVNGRRVDVVPSLEVLLEDARTRADRQHPFWAKVDVPLGRRR